MWTKFTMFIYYKIYYIYILKISLFFLLFYSIDDSGWNNIFVKVINISHFQNKFLQIANVPKFVEKWPILWEKKKGYSQGCSWSDFINFPLKENQLN